MSTNERIVRAAIAAANGQVAAMRHEAGAPTAGDDETTGAWVGLFWLDATGPALYLCTDATEGNAVWRTVADWS